MGRDFDGSTDRIDWANSTSLGSSAKTISMWIWPDSIASGQHFLAKHESGDGAEDMYIFTSSGGGRIGIFIKCSGTNMNLVSVASIIDTSGWQHIIITNDGGILTSGTHIYRNNSEPSYGTSTDGTGSANAGNGSLSLGGRIPDDAQNYNGDMAEVGIWTRVLSSDEITQLYRGAIPWDMPDSLLFYSPLWGFQSSEPDFPGHVAGSLDGTVQATSHPPVRLYNKIWVKSFSTTLAAVANEKTRPVLKPIMAPRPIHHLGI